MTIQQMMLGGSLAPLEAFAAPDSLTGLPPPLRPGPSNTSPSFVTASGGTGNYTYSWQYVSGDTETHMVQPPDAVSMSWTREIPTMPGTWISVWRCQVSDGISTITTNTVTVTFTG